MVPFAIATLQNITAITTENNGLPLERNSAIWPSNFLYVFEIQYLDCSPLLGAPPSCGGCDN